MQSNLIVVHCIWIYFIAPVVFNVTNIDKFSIIYTYIFKILPHKYEKNNFTYIHLPFHLNELQY